MDADGWQAELWCGAGNVSRSHPLYTDWTRWGLVFLIARHPPDARTRFVLYDGVRGQRVDAMDLDSVGCRHPGGLTVR